MQTKKSPQPRESDVVEGVMQNLRRLFKVVESYSRSVEAQFGLTGPQLWALSELGRSAPLSLKDLAARMHLTPSTVVGVIDRLLAKGLVQRAQDPADRRRVSLSLSPEGKALLATAPSPAQGRLIEGLNQLDPKQLTALSAGLDRLVELTDAKQVEARFFFSEE
ncbi:MAG TPA: MarR family transcriptional regulator [Holophagaceae bacterium]|nr:MarR family transcriptional regulator [Holophagaceae bacterium]